MGQIFCKDCDERFKHSAVISWEGDDSECDDDYGTYSTGATSSLRSSPSSGNLDPKRSNRIKNKKRNVALHAEFRDRQGNLIAPPMISEKVMEDTDNLFSGQDLGVDTLHNGSSSRDDSGDIPQDKSYELPMKLERTPEEDAFLDRALADDDNFVFDGLSPHFRQQLKDSMERVLVPKNTLLIRKGDNPDYLYLILEGDVAVYIDPEEYVDDTAIDLGKHAPIDISLQKTNSSSALSSLQSDETVKRGFKQSYVLNLRKSLFNSYKESAPTDMVTTEDDNLVGQVLSLVRASFTVGQDSQTSTLTGIIEEQGSAASDDDTGASFTPINELRGLKHARDLGACDLFGELALIYNCERTATCITTTNCILYRVKGETFQSILSSSNSERIKKRYTESKAAVLSLHNIGVVDDLDEKTLNDIESVLNPVTFEQDDLVMTKGAFDNMFFFVMWGKLLVTDIGTGDSSTADIELKEGGHFGEFNLLTGRPSIANVTVLSPKARLMAVIKKDYMKR